MKNLAIALLVLYILYNWLSESQESSETTVYKEENTSVVEHETLDNTKIQRLRSNYSVDKELRIENGSVQIPEDFGSQDYKALEAAEEFNRPYNKKDPYVNSSIYDAEYSDGSKIYRVKK